MPEEFIAGRRADAWIRSAGLNPAPSRTGKSYAAPPRPDLPDRTVSVPVGGVHPRIVNEVKAHPSALWLLRVGLWWPGDTSPKVGWADQLAAPQSLKYVRSGDVTDFGTIARVILHRDEHGDWSTGALDLNPDRIEDHLLDLGYEPVDVPRQFAFFGAKDSPYYHQVLLFVRPDERFAAIDDSGDFNLFEGIL